jgi:hypothetical protein
MNQGQINQNSVPTGGGCLTFAFSISMQLVKTSEISSVEINQLQIKGKDY